MALHPSKQFPQFSQEFINSYIECMLFESGRKPDFSNPLIISGDISTPQGRLLNGFTDGVHGASADDHGGLTKDGIAQASHKGIDVSKLDLAGVLAIYKSDYWDAVRGDELPYPLSSYLYDIACGTGPGRAIKIAQSAFGLVADGVIGPMTMAALTSGSIDASIAKLRAARIAFYQRIVANDATQAKFLGGWIRRANQFTVPPIGDDDVDCKV